MKTQSILIVEDNLDYQFIVSNCLKVTIPEVKPTFVSTREEALRVLELCAVGKVPIPKLILLDIYLPQREIGWQLLEEIRLKQPSVPVIVLSNSNDSEHIQQAYDLGAHSFIGKPHSYEDLLCNLRVIKTYWLEVVTLPPN